MFDVCESHMQYIILNTILLIEGTIFVCHNTNREVLILCITKNW